MKLNNNALNQHHYKKYSQQKEKKNQLDHAVSQFIRYFAANKTNRISLKSNSANLTCQQACTVKLLETEQ